ncbi:hypothetical protein PCE1_000812 [Barthelona sp. PCE]
MSDDVSELQRKFESRTSTRIRICNVVAKTKLDFPEAPNLSELAKVIRGARYMPQRFPAMYVRFSNPSVTLSLFSNGRMLMTGAKSEKDNDIAVRKLLRALRRFNCNPTNNSIDIEIVHMVVQCDLGFPIDLYALETELTPFNCIDYRPDVNAAAKVMIPSGGNAKIRVYRSGKTIALSCKTQKEVYESYLTMYPFFAACRQELTE